MLYEVVSWAPGSYRVLDIFDWPQQAEAYANDRREQRLSEHVEVRPRRCPVKSDRHEPTCGTSMRGNLEASTIRQLRNGEFELAQSLARMAGLDLQKVADACKIRLPREMLTKPKKEEGTI